jgi:hypothetical protein
MYYYYYYYQYTCLVLIRFSIAILVCTLQCIASFCDPSNCNICRYVPLEDMRAKQIKTVLCLRNPKDTAVSYYNHMKGLNIYEYDGKWEDWLPVYMQGKCK